MEETGEVVAAAVSTAPSFRVIRRTTLFTMPEGFYFQSSRDGFYDVHPDGQRFLMARVSPESETRVVLITDFFSELERLLPSD